MSTINTARLTEFANGLWAKIKQQIGEGVVNISFDADNNTLTATKGDTNNTTIDVNLTSLIGVSEVTYNEDNSVLTIAKGDGTSTQLDLSSLANNGTVKSVNSQTPDRQGNVILNAEHFQDIYSKTEVDGKFVLQTDVANQANKIPRIGGDGKLPSNIIPAIAINETFQFTRNTQSEAETAAMGQASQNGDMMVLIVGANSSDRVTKKYLCVDATQNTFAGRYIELTFPTDGVTEGELNTALQSYVLTSDTGIGANQVLRLDAQGKIDDSNLKLATSEEINTIINALQ